MWGSDESGRPVTYLHATLAFGDGPAGSVAQLALQMMAERFGAGKELARTALIRSAYVDDIASGGGSVEEVETISRDIDSILACGGFSAKPLHRTGQDGETSILGMSWDKGEDSVTHHSKSWRSVSPPHSRVGRSGGLYKHSTIRWACWRP